MKRLANICISVLFFSVIAYLDAESATKNVNAFCIENYLVKIELPRYEEIYQLSASGVSILQDLQDYVIAKLNPEQMNRLQKALWNIEILDINPNKKLYFMAQVFDEHAISSLDKVGEVLCFDGEIVLFRTSEEKIKNITTRRMKIRKLRDSPIKLIRREEQRQSHMTLTWNPLIQEMVDSVSQNDVTNVIRTLQNFVSRNSFNHKCDSAVDWVYDKFVSYGLDSVYFHNYSSSYAPNVIGVLKGAANTDSVYIICGHVDATAGSPYTNESVAPGADDNGSGSACVILAAKVMSNYTFRHDVRFICFTGEEQGLVGSSYYASAHSSENICGVLNFDMAGYANFSPEDLDLSVNSASVWLADAMIAAANAYVGLPTYKHTPPTCVSDNGSFWDEGKFALNGIEDKYCCSINPYYHSVRDTLGAGLNDIPFVTKVVKVGLAALAELAVPLGQGADEKAGPTSSSVPLLSQNLPNPFSQKTAISYKLPVTDRKELSKSDEQQVTLNIYNLSGQLVRPLVEEKQRPGYYTIYWDGKDSNGNRVRSGIYIYKLSGSGYTICRKTVFVR